LLLSQAFSKLSTLAEQRGDAYANADVRVSLEGMIPIITLVFPAKKKHWSSPQTHVFSDLEFVPTDYSDA
jgi:hypothetical protein